MPPRGPREAPGGPLPGSGAMDVTKPYKFIGFGAMDVTKPYKFIGFGDFRFVFLGTEQKMVTKWP